MTERWTRPAVIAVGLLISGILATPGAVQAQDDTMADDPDNPYGEILVAEATPAEAPPLPAGTSELVTVRTLEDDDVVEFVVGPVDLQPGMAHLRLPIQMAEFPIDGWIHGFSIDMRDEAGNDIPMDLLHHVNFIDPDKRELFAPISRRVMAAGRETATERLPDLIGYPVSQGDRMMIAAMFANTLEEPYADAHLHVRFFVSDESDGMIQPRNVFPFYMDVMGLLGTKDFAVPPGQTVVGWEGSPAVEGRILGVGGHVHDYATRLSLIDVTTGETLWEVEPEGEAGGHITGVPSSTFFWTLGKKIETDHVYRIEVEYDNPTDAYAPDGGMGAIGGVVWVGKDTEWPAFDRTDWQYIADLTNTLTAPERLAGHGHGGMDHGAMDHDAMSSGEMTEHDDDAGHDDHGDHDGMEMSDHDGDEADADHDGH